MRAFLKYTLFLFVSPCFAQLSVITASGNTAVTTALNDLRTLLGPNNGINANSSGSGRREVNWDATPNGFAAPNTLPGNFFNQNSQRGLQLLTVGAGTGFMVSDASTGGNGVGVNFANLNASYSTTFSTFSPEKLFTSIGNNVFDVVFFEPKTGAVTPGDVPAEVTAFAVVFSDVDQAGTTAMQFFDSNGVSLAAFATSPGAINLFGGKVAIGTPGIARVRITLGNTAMLLTNSPNDNNGSSDLVVTDDFVYGEPFRAKFVQNGFE